MSWSKAILVSLVTFVTVALVPLLSTGLAQDTKKAANDSRESDADFYILPGIPFEETFLDLPGQLPPEFPDRQILVRDAQAGGRHWLLPVYVVKELRIPDRLSATEHVTLTLYDALYHPQMQSVIHKAMDASFKDNWQQGKPIDNRVEVTLWVKVADEHSPLAVARFSREAGQPKIIIPFDVDATSAERLAKADRSQLGLTFSEPYRGRYRQVDLTATLNTAYSTALAFQNKLDSDRNGQKAMLLVTIGGGVNQNLAVQQYFGRQVTIEVLTREGKEVNQTLVDNIVGRLFTGLQDEVNLGRQRDEQVVTFLLANGLKATASIGTFKGIKDQLRTEAERLTEKANSLATKDRAKRDIETSVNGSFLGIGGGGSMNVRWEDEHERASSESSKLQTRDLMDMAKAIEGELPVAALNANQLQALTTRVQSGLQLDIGTFRDVRRTLESRMSLQAYTIMKEGRAESLAKLQEKKRNLERELKNELEKLSLASAQEKQQLSGIDNLPKTFNGSIAAVEKDYPMTQYENGFVGTFRHINNVWHWQPPGGEATIQGHMNARDPGQSLTRRELTQAAQRNVTDNIAAIRNSAAALLAGLTTSESQNAEIIRSYTEITRLQGEIDKVDRDLEEYLGR